MLLEPKSFNGFPLAGSYKVITSPYSYVTKRRVKGIPSARKANTRRPFYRYITVKIPVAVMMGGSTVIMPPAMAEALKNKMTEQARILEAEALGFFSERVKAASDSIHGVGLSWSDLSVAAMVAIKSMPPEPKPASCLDYGSPLRYHLWPFDPSS